MTMQLNVLEKFRFHAARDGDAPAVVSEHARMSYRELDSRSDTVACALQARGIGSGSLVPIEASRNAEFVVGILGILKAGATYVPIDDRYPAARKHYILQQCNAALVLTTRAAPRDAAMPFASVAELSARRPAHDDACAPPLADARDGAIYVIFTSGSTGAPKGVIVEHAAVAALVDWHNTRFEMNAASRATLMAGLGFDVSQWEIWSTLCAGATLFLPDDETRLDADALVAFLARHGITHAYVPTVMVADVVGVGQPADLKLKYLFTAGEKLGPVDTDGVHYTVIDYYGPTEATIFATCHVVPSATLGRPASIGRPVGDTEILILNDAGEAVTGSDVGEICIGGPGLARGYLGNPALTREKFRPHPRQTDRLSYHTGDLGRWLNDGAIQFLGRLDDQVKIRGNLVELSEIQAALVRSGDVRKAVVLALPNAAGAGTELVAFVVPRDPVAPPARVIEALKASVRQALPDYMWPVGHVLLDDVPVTANGKTDRAALERRYRDAPRDRTEHEPYTAVERIVADAFAALIGHASFRKTDRFFDIGGNSLLTAKLARALSDAVGTKMLIRDVYEHQSVEALAREIERRAATTALVIEREPVYALENDIRVPEQAEFSGPFDDALLAAPRTILLTGATGFVGVHLLAELLATTSAVVHCLVRAPDAAAARARIDEKLRAYDVSLGPDDRSRIRVWAGDVTHARFGLGEHDYAALADEIDVVYHSASAVNFIQPYSYMKKINVDGLTQILAFAGHRRTKALILLSTISVYSWGHRSTGKTVMTEADDIDQNLPAVLEDIGYTRSKWVMEKMADQAAQRGLPLMTFRLGYATFHGETGVSADYQWWGRLVKTCIALGTVPDLNDLREGLTSVDYMTKAIARISRDPAALGRKFNLINSPETDMTLKEFFSRLERYFGMRFRVVPYRAWLDAWKTDIDAPLYPLLSLFDDNIRDGMSTAELYQNNYVWDCRNVIEFLEGSGIEQPAFSREQLARYLERSIGYRVAATPDNAARTARSASR
ncbi:amino acid adenylation domain-containing protein [Burkholderia cenocepacia]|uniref:non-ribosomal peptide synthetase n=1 Tax=Burkholderia cenocepacia TaxID=95486 RepID=UPI00285AEDFF|nr:amino acid adenylation domain-containing protein [Burkholderia cenocepacia]MDR5666011.1 amino acid adenylation domain-containing protein [Burkholderia cenocepacia]MDR5669024.1 amino acid adenylation domain-containing protein [Burkholderia cenocepacia]MDR8098261.1 amino acid adenylation domain-containing protein [Burkholderia cenocepacia]